MLDKCGEQNGTFYDRRGDYFREGVDPRNHVGRFLNFGIRKVDSHVYWLGHTEWVHEYDCPAGFSDSPCDCGVPN